VFRYEQTKIMVVRNDQEVGKQIGEPEVGNHGLHSWCQEGIIEEYNRNKG